MDQIETFVRVLVHSINSKINMILEITKRFCGHTYNSTDHLKVARTTSI